MACQEPSLTLVASQELSTPAARQASKPSSTGKGFPDQCTEPPEVTFALGIVGQNAPEGNPTSTL
jgi:hypothetical protein